MAYRTYHDGVSYRVVETPTGWVWVCLACGKNGAGARNAWLARHLWTGHNRRCPPKK